ncbi:MAG: GNAT family N-acetyltransferase, partial [Gemmatimonadaceae bacterium]
DPAVAIWRLVVDGSDAGYFELRRGAVELPPDARAFGGGDPGGGDPGGDDSGGGDSVAAVAPASERPWELAYFGLVRGVQGRGLGRWLLERAIAEAWAGGADLLWLHTCSLDHPAAIPNYRARGFRPFATLLYEEDVADWSDRAPRARSG